MAITRQSLLRAHGHGRADRKPTVHSDRGIAWLRRSWATGDDGGHASASALVTAVAEEVVGVALRAAVGGVDDAWVDTRLRQLVYDRGAQIDVRSAADGGLAHGVAHAGVLERGGDLGSDLVGIDADARPDGGDQPRRPDAEVLS